MTKNLDWEELGFEFQTTSISLTKMAKRENTTRQTLSKHFKELGIDVINKQNRCKFNCNIFDSIDSEEKAYWLGFIFADGYIGNTPIRDDKKNVYNFELSLQLSDVHHLEKFRNFISYEKPVTVDTYRCRILVANKHFWRQLNKLGCIPRKSLKLKFPKITIFKEIGLIRHFIRGYFDGDGCISRYVHTHIVSPNVSVVGTEHFLKYIIKESKINARMGHDKRNAEENKYIYYNLKNSILFINYLYTNANIYLDRKYKLYQFFKNGSRSVKEFTELLSGNIGESCEANTEIISEITKGSEIQQSVVTE